jgi:hypothetical protein
MRKIEDKDCIVIGGSTLICLGISFIFLEQSPLLFLGCIMLGIGGGLMISTFMKKK